MLSRTSVLLLLLLLPVSLESEEYPFHWISLEDGLSNNSVYRIEQDSAGYLWFGTFSGLNRYDGTEIRTYKPEPGKRRSISSPVIFDIYEDSQQRLWIATDGGGLNLYHPVTDDFTVYNHDNQNKNSISSNIVYALCEDDQNNLWIGTGGAGLNLFHEEEESFRVFTSSPSPHTLDSSVIRVLFADSAGVLWVGTQGGGLSRRYGDNAFRNYRYDPHKPGSISSDTVRSLFEDSSRRLWVGTEGGGLNLFDPDTEIFTLIENESLKHPQHYSVRSINEDGEGRLWVGTEGQGVFLLNRQGEIIQNISSKEGNYPSLSKDKIRDIFVDKNELIWIGTRGGGLSRFNPRTMGLKLDQDREVRGIFQDSFGDLWIGSDGGGLVHIKGDSGERELFLHRRDDPRSISSNQIYTIMESRDKALWIGTDGGGLNRLDRETKRFVRYQYSAEDPHSLRSNTVWSLLEDSSGLLWAGTEGGGLNLYHPETDSFQAFQSVPEDNTTLNGNSVRVIFEDSNTDLWVGTWDGGLNQFHRETQTFTRFSRDPEDKNSLSGSSVNTIYEDSLRRFWVGTAAGGLNLLDRETGVFLPYRTDQGMAGDNIRGILEDEQKNLWISTDRGISMLNLEKNQILNFSQADGLLSNEFSINAQRKLTNGEMLFGGPRGIDQFHPSEISVNRTEPPVVITGISVMNKKIPYVQGSDSVLTLSPKENTLSLSFAVMDYTDSKRSRYAAILEGLQDEWTNLEGQNSIVYTGLPPGDYRFRVKGANHNGIWNSTGASLSLRVQPPWWRTSFFYGVCLLLFSFLILGIYKLRVYRLTMKNKELRDYSIHIQDVREEERTSVAREVHDELGQTLTVLKMEIFRMNDPQSQSMLDLINSSLDAVKDLSTRLRPKVLDNLRLEEAVAWLARDFSERSSVKVIEELDQRLSVEDGDIKTALFRICQEVLTNIIRHSGADEVRLSLKARKGLISLRIEDNGCGISQESLEKKRSFGIRGMKERCRYLGGQFAIKTAEGGGTVVSAVIPQRRENKNA